MTVEISVGDGYRQNKSPIGSITNEAVSYSARRQLALCPDERAGRRRLAPNVRLGLMANNRASRLIRDRCSDLLPPGNVRERTCADAAPQTGKQPTSDDHDLRRLRAPSPSTQRVCPIRSKVWDNVPSGPVAAATRSSLPISNSHGLAFGVAGAPLTESQKISVKCVSSA